MRVISNGISRFGLAAALLILPSLAAASAADQYNQYGTQLLMQRKYDEAAKYFNSAAKADPRNATAWKGLGFCYAGKGDKAKALQYLKYSAQLNPNDAQVNQYLAAMGGGAAAPAAGGASASDPYYAKGVQYMQAKQYQYAAYYFNQATQADPNSAKSWQGLGNAFFAQGNKPKAIQAWERAVALDPSNTQLAQYVASLKGATPSADIAPTASAQAPAGSAGEKQAGFNPWIMGLAIATLGGIMLFVF